MYDLPILILTYNRPKHLSKVLFKLKKINPKKIYISCDGPKNNFDKKKILIIQKKIKLISSKTKVISNFFKINQGIRLAPQKGITWFFKKEKIGIILEDDCVPSNFFFKYMRHLLPKYENDKKIFAISGYNPFGKTKFGNGTYFPSNYFLCWGWGSWRRSWNSSAKKIDYFLYKNTTNNLKAKFENKIEIRYWKKIINLVHNNLIKTWDIQFLISAWKNNSYCLLPNVNMINNIGFDNSGTTSPGLKFKTAISVNYNKTIVDPRIMQIDRKNEELIFNKIFSPFCFLYPWRIFYLMKYLLCTPRLFFTKIITFIYRKLYK